jgi:hypothetical protein
MFADFFGVAFASGTETAVLSPDIIKTMQPIATILFALAVLHTFAVKRFLHLAHKYPEGSIGENFFHFLGEVEVVFGMWAGVLVAWWSIAYGTASSVIYLESVNFTEPAFVFVIMCMAATRPVLYLASESINKISALLPMPPRAALFLVTMILGPLLGSFITEPAAMTVTALLLKKNFFDGTMSKKFRYATIGLLFVNISIGGTMTHFAAPPVLMVAGPWKWDTAFMMTHFGWKAAVACAIGAILTTLMFAKELKQEQKVKAKEEKVTFKKPPMWVIAGHMIFMAVTIFHSHHMSFFIPLFLFFVGWCTVTQEFQEELKIKESLLVAFFLGGLVTLGGLQSWWIQPLLTSLGDMPLYFGATVLTAVTDNAALTYLGTLVPDLSDSAKYALVAGAVTGGGLTVIANAPNPAGYSILSPTFGEEGISPIGLLLGALPYTIIAIFAFLLLPSF